MNFSLENPGWKNGALVLMIAGIVLIGAVLAYLQSPWRGLPYRDAFASGKIKDWIAYAGNWSVVDGAIKNDSSDRGAKFVAGSSHWKDYSVEADLQLLGEGDSGLIIRASDIERGVDSYNGYYAGLRTNDDTLVLGRAEHGWIEFPPVKMPQGVVPGKWYHLKVDAYGCSMSVTATEIGTSNTAIVTARDPDCFRTGKIGLRSMVAGGIWRNIQVKRLSNEAAIALAAVNSPSSAAVYPTSQGAVPSTVTTNLPAPQTEHSATAESVQPTQKLRLFSTTRPAHVVVRGAVILTDPLFVQDSSGGVEVDLKAKSPLKVGDEIEVEGDVFPHGLTASIRNATARPLGGLAPIPPLSVTADQAATGAFHAMFIEIEGALYEKSALPDGLEELALRDGQQSFRATTNSTATAGFFKKLEKNSILRLRGVCMVDAAHTQDAVPFIVLVSSADDIRVLVGPPWWSAEHLIVLAIVMLGLGFGVHLLYSRAEQWRLHAVINERERLAHEIHDTLAQSFAGIGFQLRAIRNKVSKSKTPLEHAPLLDELNLACELVRHSHDEARRSIATLRPDATEAGGLITALEQSARQMVGRGTVSIEASVEGEIRTLPLRVLDSLFRIGQESIANAIQHGHPTKLSIRAIYSSTEIALCIEDDGMGFIPRPDADGFGLTGMQRRVEGIRGTLSVDTVPGKGTRIVAKAPAPPARYRFWRLAYDGDGEQESTNDAQ